MGNSHKEKRTKYEWDQDVPKHWKVKKLKFLLRPGNKGIKIGPFGSMLKLEDLNSDGAYKVYGQTNVIKRDFDLGKKFITDRKFNELSAYRIETGDIVITMMGTTGLSMIVPKGVPEGIMDSHLTRVRTNALLKHRFLEILINGADYILRQRETESKGAIMAGLNSSILKELTLLVPPTEEQTAIANYLDYKTTLIDRLIEKNKKLIALLEEKRAAVINQAVTKGLDPKVKMKDSGVEWIGEVPEHWEMKKLKYLTKLLNIKGSGGKQVGLENIISKKAKYIGTEGDFSGEGIMFEKGDILFGKLRPYLAKVWEATFEGEAVGDFFVMRPNRIIYRSYLMYLILSNTIIDLLNGSTYGAKMPRVSWEFMGSVLLPLPPYTEQKAIAEYLNAESTNINNVISGIKKKTMLLKEYHQSLISHVVTGKIDVRQEKIPEKY